MRRLVEAVWLSAAIVLVCGWYFWRAANALEVRPVHSRGFAAKINDDLSRPGSPRVPSVRPGLPGAHEGGVWRPHAETAEERKYRMAHTLPSSDQARAADNAIRIRMRYHALYTSLGLNAAEIARFEGALSGRVDLFTRIVGLSPEQEASVRESQARDLDGVVQQTLGAAAVPKVREYVATADYREIAEKLAANTYFTDTPLTGTQAERLIQACMDCRTSPGNGIRNDPNAVNWDQVLAQAGSFLSPGQQSALQGMVDIRRFDSQFLGATGLPYRSPVRNF